jgi:hypothetical protein
MIVTVYRLPLIEYTFKIIMPLHYQIILAITEGIRTNLLTEKTAFSSGQMTTYNVYQLKILEFLSINIILREGYLWQISLVFLLICDICL